MFDKTQDDYSNTDLPFDNYEHSLPVYRMDTCSELARVWIENNLEFQFTPNGNGGGTFQIRFPCPITVRVDEPARALLSYSRDFWGSIPDIFLLKKILSPSSCLMLISHKNGFTLEIERKVTGNCNNLLLFAYDTEDECTEMHEEIKSIIKEIG